MIENENSRYPIAYYKDPGLPEYADNPLIAALPEILSPIEVSEILKKTPIFKQEETALPGHIRVHAINRLTRNFFVPQTLHILLEQKFSVLVRKSYLGRNPKTARFKRKLNSIRNIIQNHDLTSYIHDDFDSFASSMAIVGISGAGKSTTTNILLNHYPRVIYHPDYNLLQVPWIKIDCPYDGSLAEFCESFFIALDRRLNTNYRQKYTAGKPRIGKLIADVADLCLIHAIGLIVVDEFQHMNLAKSGGEKKMINFLVTLVNVVEVSVVLIGTPKALRLFSSEFRQARRAAGEGSLIWDRLPFDESWDDFTEELWKYQWLQAPMPLDEAMKLKLYELSQGIPDIVIKLFCIAQARAILLAGPDPEDEYLSTALLEDVFDEELSVVKPMLESLRKNKERTLEMCDDLVVPNIESALLNTFDHLKPNALKKKANLEMGNETETDLAKSAFENLTAMGVSPDIAEPLIREVVQSNPKATLIQIIHQATSSFSNAPGTTSSQQREKANIMMKKDSWGQLPARDLRKIYFDKTGSMYEALDGEGLIYPLKAFLSAS
ncbi:ATP-binding protein [Geoalkalibacter halelectricus]|uniref:ATP-binding protein n=1 Tax=Geoalkalibacter halelectricus TaxID=2847045 RepID=A0ABY5ZU96_9BACT|nr:ATP-binding protein [Geoalkalibacter halelectricus]MDO3377717.1 ATP-binding protein [Geoalkalibacter halelectricus]UWZ81505.1 ATP-binding protein [Geoalkalibacter halelectricus]